MNRRKFLAIIPFVAVLASCENPFKPKSKPLEKFKFTTIEEALAFLKSIGAEINWDAKPTDAEIIAFANYLAGHTDYIFSKGSKSSNQGR